MSTQLKLAGTGAIALLSVLAIWNASRGEALDPGLAAEEPRMETGSLPEITPRQEPTEGAREVANLDLPVVPVAIPEAEPGPSTGALLLRFTYADGSLAGNRGVSLMPWESGDPWVERASYKTDDVGELFVEAVRPGTHFLKVDITNGWRVTVVAGELNEVDLVIPAGVQVHGLVQNPAGDPVAGARVWLSEYGVDTSGFVVAESAADGSFLLEHIPHGRRIGAMAKGYGPARLRQVLGDVGHTVEMVLRLQSGGAQLLGRVSDPAGNPLPRALVTYLPDNSRERTGATGELDLGSPPYETRSDAHGDYAFEGLPVGRGVFYVRLPGWAPVKQVLDLVNDDLIRKPITLQKAGIVHGVVRDSGGGPVSGARIQCGGHYGAPDFSMSHSDAEGRYRLENLPVGLVEISATHEGTGELTATHQLLSGTPIEWNPQLERGLILSGRVQDTHGQPLAGWYVEVAGMRPPPGERFYWLEQRKTDSDGRFEIIGCPEYALRAKLIRPPYSNNAVASKANFHAYDGDLDFVIDTDSVASASVSALVLDFVASPVIGTAQIVGVGGERFREEQQVSAGRLQFKDLTAGRYSLTVTPVGAPSFPLGVVELFDGQELELESFRLPEPARLTVLSSRADAFGTMEVNPETQPGDPRLRPSSVGDPIGQELTLWPAKYGLQLLGDGTAPVNLTVELAAGESKELSVEPVPGVLCHLRCSLPSGAADPPFMGIRVSRGEGSIAHWMLLNPVELDYTKSVLLAPGEYSVRAGAMGEYVGEVTFTVLPGSGEQVLHVPMKKP